MQSLNDGACLFKLTHRCHMYPQYWHTTRSSTPLSQLCYSLRLPSHQLLCFSVTEQCSQTQYPKIQSQRSCLYFESTTPIVCIKNAQSYNLFLTYTNLSSFFLNALRCSFPRSSCISLPICNNTVAINLR